MRTIRRDKASDQEADRSPWELVFDTSPEPHPKVGRVFRPGRDVWVDLRLLFRGDMGGPNASGLALIVRSQGIVLNQIVPGELHA